MDSIHRQEMEDPRKDLSGGDAITVIREIVEHADTCFFCTSSSSSDSTGVRPMSVRKIDEQGDLWFLSATDSHKNHDIAADPTVTLYFQSSPHSGFLQLTGRGHISRDPEKIRELWNPMIKTWFTGGVEDPRITVIRVTPRDGYYWDTKHGGAIAAMKMVVGAVIGKTMDDSVEGRLVL
jgi:general stress protein 26